jgi:large subunit ribosomal protein L17
MTSRAIGREVLKDKLRDNKPVALINSGVEGVEELVEREVKLDESSQGLLRPKTRWSLQKVLRYRDASAVSEVAHKAGHYADSLLASPIAFKNLHEEGQKDKKTTQPPLPLHIRRVGQTLPGQTSSALSLSKGALGHPQHRKTEPHLSLRSMFGSKQKTL